MTLYHEANGLSEAEPADQQIQREAEETKRIFTASGSVPAADLLTLIVPQSHARRVMRQTREVGIVSATLMYAQGTVHGFLADLFGLNEDRKAVIMMAVPGGKGHSLLHEIAVSLGLNRPNQGIGFRTGLSAVLGMHQEGYGPENDAGEERSGMSKREESANTGGYKAVVTIVDRGRAEEVMDAAIKGGAMGGTIMHGRGSGVHETAKVFNMEIEPEKEIILILVRDSIAEDVVESIRKETKVDEPGQGIIFVQDIAQAVGLYGDN